ncbi:hypothetical protein AAFF_G00411710 [Aldrovandia affinis]|uniref:Uncharacterized protein n=1 Tax=Aldrovandia affinis TaxID=143900 RepID=A0AAD7SBC4_9TELE|nr:hypothetical protein AAFF_G00411710 [Aldrovandia affinis]
MAWVALTLIHWFKVVLDDRLRLVTKAKGECQVQLLQLEHKVQDLQEQYLEDTDRVQRLQEELEQQRANNSGINMQEHLITLREQLQEVQHQQDYLRQADKQAELRRLKERLDTKTAVGKQGLSLEVKYAKKKNHAVAQGITKLHDWAPVLLPPSDNHHPEPAPIPTNHKCFVEADSFAFPKVYVHGSAHLKTGTPNAGVGLRYKFPQHIYWKKPGPGIGKLSASMSEANSFSLNTLKSNMDSLLLKQLLDSTITQVQVLTSIINEERTFQPLTNDLRKSRI